MSADDNPTVGHPTTRALDPTASGAQDHASNEPDAIRADIERTRSDLSRDVNALSEAVSPSGIAKRQTSKVGAGLKRAVTQAKRRTTRHARAGQVSDSHSSSSQTLVVDSAPGTWDRTAHVAHATMDRAKGSPLAVGLIALLAGWALGRFLPPSRRGSKARN